MLTRGRRWGFEAVVGVMLVATVLGRFLPGFGAGPRIRAWSTITVAIFLQALPFLVLGVLWGAVIAVFTSPERLRRLLPSRGVPAVLVGGSAGLLLPGCECASVPVSGRLMAGGVPAGAALAFMLSAPAINPVVSPTAQLTFTVVGPVVDLKLVSMQVGVFGRRFAGRFAPTALVVAIACSVVVGWWL